MMNLTQEEQMKVNLLAGSFMAGLFRGTGVALKFSGAALKTTAGVTSAVLNKTADIVNSAGNTGGEILIGLGEKADEKASEYEDALNVCQRIFNSGAKPLNEVA